MNDRQPTPAERNTPPDDEWAKAVCKIGQGAATCRYLALGPSGWSCEKATALARIFDAKVLAGTMGATADNCDGRLSA